MIRPAKLALISSILILALPAFAAVQDANPTPQSTPPEAKSTVPTLQVFTRETIVDVIVTDAKGHPVRGLKQSDFIIKEDGKPQPMRSFGEFDRGFAKLIRQTPNPDPEIHTNDQPSPPTGPVNIILIDALHLNYVATIRSKQATSAYVARMPQGTQVAVFWLSMSGLHMLQGFTSDPSALQQAVSVARTDIGSNEDCYAIDRVTIDALNQIAAYVAGIKGRKNLIWIAPGAPVYLLRDGGYGWGRSTSCRTGSQPRVFGADRTDGYSLFTGIEGSNEDGIDMGIVHRLMDTYELFSTEQIAVSPLNPNGVQALAGAELVAEEVAAQSGGFAKYNSNDLTSELAEAIDQSSHYYTLSYIPPRRKDDGHYHTINIQANQPGLHLVYRKGYNSEDPRQPKQFSGPDLIKAALQGKMPAATQLLFDAKLVPVDPLNIPTPAPASAAKKEKSTAQRTPYDLLLAVPQNQIAFGKGPDLTRTVNLEFAFDAYDLNGKFLGSHSQKFNISLTPDRFDEFILDPVIFHERISFFPGPLFLRVGVLDGISNKVGTLEIALTVPKK